MQSHARAPGRAVHGADPRVLRRGSRRARLSRGRRAPRPRSLRRARAGRRRRCTRSATSARTSFPPGPAAVPSRTSRRALSPRMLIGEEAAVTELWEAGRKRFRRPREDRPSQPVYVSTTPPEPGGTGLRLATGADLDTLVPACARAHEEEVGVDPLRRDPNGFRWRTRTQIEEGRSWLWLEDGVIKFKAEASAWTPAAVQLQQVWVDPPARREGNASRALRDGRCNACGRIRRAAIGAGS